MPETDFTLIPAKQEDMEYVLDRLVEAYFENSFPLFGPERSREQVRAECRYYLDPHATSGIRSRLTSSKKKPPHDILLGVDAGGAKAGCMIIGVNKGAGLDVAWVYLLFVERESRRHGLGRLMLAKAEEWARGHGMKALMLSVKTQNEGAMDLYGSFGLKPCKMWMRKIL